MTATATAIESKAAFQRSQELERDFVCGECASPLVTVKPGDRWVAVCGKDRAHVGITSHQQVAADEIRERLETDPRVAQALAVQGMRVSLPTQALARLDDKALKTRIEVAYGGLQEVTPQQRDLLFLIGQLYGLDPITDITIYEGKPWVTVEGRLRKLREHPEYRGHTCRPLNPDEKRDWGYEADDLVIQCDVRTVSHGTITDWGIVRAAEVKAALDRARTTNRRSAPVGTSPQQIALKRAVSRASRQAVGLDIPDDEDLAAHVVVDGEARVVEPEQPPPTPLGDDVPVEHNGRQVDARTGEVLTDAAHDEDDDVVDLRDPESRARARFWATARQEPPEGLGLDADQVHELLKVQTLTGYPGGWGKALEDLCAAAGRRRIHDPKDPLMRGWERLVKEAIELGIHFEPLAFPTDEQTIVSKGKALRQQVDKARAAKEPVEVGG